MPRKVGEPLYLAVVRSGQLVIYRDGAVVARFDQDAFPQVIRDMADALHMASTTSE